MGVGGRQKGAVRKAKRVDLSLPVHYRSATTYFDDGSFWRILSTGYARRPIGRRIAIHQMLPFQAFVCMDGFVSTQIPAIEKEAV
jgi:hypothetical protein